MTLEEILSIEDVATKISYLKKGRKYPLPNAVELYSDWNCNRHEIVTDTEKYPKIKLTIREEKEVFDETTMKPVKIPAETKLVDPNRISIPLEQDIVNIQTAFTVGIEPTLECTPSDDDKPMYDAIVQVFKKNKLKYQNRSIVRSWLSETECAEYWYVVKDDGFWRKVKSFSENSISIPEYRLKSAVWSPFKGDRLYPFFDEKGDMIAFSREYNIKGLDGVLRLYFMTITKDTVYIWESDPDWKVNKVFKHGFEKIPVIYCHRRRAYCDNIKPIRIRIEKLMSENADCIDYHFFPILKLFGDVDNFSGEFKNRIVRMSGEGADAAYLTWNQSSDPVKHEFEKLLNMAYAMTNTPRISFDQLQGLGNTLSGTAFRFMFMGAHMAVENHSEVIGEFMQRRVNFLVSALGSISQSLKKSASTIDIETNIVPYMIDDIGEKVKVAVEANQGGVWSRRKAIVFAGNAERLDEEMNEIEEEMKSRQANNANME